MIPASLLKPKTNTPLRLKPVESQEVAVQPEPTSRPRPHRDIDTDYDSMEFVIEYGITPDILPATKKKSWTTRLIEKLSESPDASAVL